MGLSTAAGGSRTATRRRAPRWANGWAGIAHGYSGGAPTSSCWPPGMRGAARSRTRSTTLASTSPRANAAARLDWPNSTLLHGDVPAAVADLKQNSSANLVIMGSGVLIGSLMAADLIDEYLLMIAPLVLGTGRRLFAGGMQASLRLVDSSSTNTGVLIAAYEPARG